MIKYINLDLSQNDSYIVMNKIVDLLILSNNE